MPCGLFGCGGCKHQTPAPRASTLELYRGKFAMDEGTSLACTAHVDNIYAGVPVLGVLSYAPQPLHRPA
eukprot:199646-Rhodomonas_salina.1